MKSSMASIEPGTLMDFVILKSYDGGKKWERERQCRDFVTAVDLAQTLRTQHPSIRFRVNAEAAGRPAVRGRRKPRRA